MKVLYMSGYPEALVSRQGILTSHVSFLEKPFSDKALMAKISEMLESD